MCLCGRRGRQKGGIGTDIIRFGGISNQVGYQTWWVQGNGSSGHSGRGRIDDRGSWSTFGPNDGKIEVMI